MKHVYGSGNVNAKLLVIGEAPEYYEEQSGIPFTGPSGDILDSMLVKAGISRSEVFVDNVVTVRPPENKINRLKELGLTVDSFYPRLFELVKNLKPNAILALGNTPLYAFTGKTGISKYRGSILFSSITGTKVVPSIHPAYILHGSDQDEGGSFKYSTRIYMQLDVNRAVEESRSKEYKVPPRNIQIIRDSLSLYRFLQSYKEHCRFSLDIETRKSIPVCLGIAPSSKFAVSVQLMNIEETDYKISSQELAEIHYLLAEFLASDRQWIGQNFKFDHQKLESIWGFHFRPGSIYADTMLMQRTINPEFPANLAFITSVYTREPYYKDEGKEFQYGKSHIDQLFTYNAKDCLVTFEAFEALDKELDEYKLKSFFYNYVMKLHDFYMDLEAEGFQVDEEIWKGLITKYKDLWKEKQSRLEALIGWDVNVASPKQVFGLLTKDLGLPLRESTNEESLVALLGNHTKDEKTRETLNLIIDIRRIRKTIGTYLSAYPDGDGKLRTSYRIVGTETGRSSTSKCDIPLRPFDGFGLAFQTLTKHGSIGADIRKGFIPGPGYVFLECDLSQAEARVVALLANDDITLKLFDEADIHTVTSSWIFNCKPERTEGNVTEDKRFIGKTCRHAGNYGEGKRRLMLDVNANARRFGIPISISEKRAGEILTIFHSKTPKIRGVFHAEVQAGLQHNNRILINAYGRRRQFFNKWGDPLFREAYAFIPSSTVKDHLSMAGLRIKDRIPGIRFVVESHDALVAMIKENEIATTARIFKEEFERPINFENCTLKRGTIVIPSEIKIGRKNYKELEDYKVA
jgi:uracil-DNA glycosylase family 4